MAAAKLCLLKPERKAAYDAKPQRSPTTRPATKPLPLRPAVLVATAGVVVLILGAAFWAFFSAGRAGRSEARPVVANPPAAQVVAGQGKADVAKRPEIPQPEVVRPKETRGSGEDRGGKKEKVEVVREAAKPGAAALAPAAAKLGRAIPGDTAKKTLTNSIGMQLVLIPAGEFLMGSTPEEIAWAAEEGKRRNEAQWYFDRIPSEAPRHPVRISRPFYLGVYEVTQAEYEQVMGANPSSFSAKGENAGKVTGMDTSRHPVETVSWEDATAFCQKVSALPKERSAHRVYRLPTEAEWEYACRAGSTGRWSFENSPLPSRERGGGEGEAALGDHAWFTSNSSGMTHPVGQKKPNAFGLFDMHGNVWEWCMDWFGQDYYRQSLPVDPIGPSSGSDRVLRGGSWYSNPCHCRSAFRSRDGREYRYQFRGFRVVAVR